MNEMNDKSNSKPASDITAAKSSAADGPHTEAASRENIDSRIEQAAKHGLFHSEKWQKAIEATFGTQFEYFQTPLEPNQQTAYSFVSDIRGERVISTPFSDFCDPGFETQAGWQAFADHLLSFERPVTVRPFANQFALGDERFNKSGGLVWHGIDLCDGADGVMANIKSKIRTKIRRVAKHGVQFDIASGPEAIDEFHKMHVGLRKYKYRLLAQPKSLFQNLFENFGDDMAIAFARLDGELLAGMVFFAYQGVWYYKFSASYLTSTRPNPALMMFGAQQAQERGMHLIDMGRSDLDQPGLVDFKEQFEPEKRLLYTLSYSPADYSDPRGQQTGALLGALTKQLTDPSVPDEITTNAGELMYRYFA